MLRLRKHGLRKCDIVRKTMNTDTENNKNSAKSAFGDRGTNVNAMHFGHLHADKILNEICEILRESETGRLLLTLVDKKQVPVHIMKGKGETGYSPHMNTIFMQIPGKTKEAKPEHVIQFAKALHEAGQEFAGFKAPEPGKDLMAYASFIHGRNLDSITETCKILKELSNSQHFTNLLDSLHALGLYSVYKAYIDGASRDELYKEYAEAYETLSEGV